MEVLFEHSVETPRCAHGPCLLFRRPNGEEFFACAVYRSRKDCSFYQSLLDPRKSSKSIQEPSDQNLLFNSHNGLMERLKKLKSIAPEKRKFCMTCSYFVLPGDKESHRDHETEGIVSNKQLKNPTALLRPLTDKQKEAYWFSSQTIDLLMQWIRHPSRGFDAVLCIGAPRLFEALQNRTQLVSSFLLDYDARFAQFWGPKKFARFSMLANHLFAKKGKYFLAEFLKNSAKLLIVVDPPFGVLLSPLVRTIKALESRHSELREDKKAECDFMIALPYFLDQKLNEHAPALRPCDYKVEYESVTGTGTKKDYSVYKDKSQPVRFFTTIPLSALPLPANLGYKHCNNCDRDVAKENAHCKHCKICPMRGSVPYKHCGKCNSCVPSNTGHCVKCGKCHKDGSRCREEEAERPALVHSESSPQRKRSRKDVEWTELPKKKSKSKNK